jgi:hypothetical protein
VSGLCSGRDVALEENRNVPIPVPRTRAPNRAAVAHARVNAVGTDDQVGAHGGPSSPFLRVTRPRRCADDFRAKAALNSRFIRDSIEQHALQRRPTEHHGLRRLASLRERSVRACASTIRTSITGRHRQRLAQA